MAPSYLAALSLLALTSSCAGVKFFDGSDQEKGLVFYDPKPYLLVSRTGSKDKPVDVSIVMLPDFSKPHRAVYKRGLGSHTFAVTLDKGILTAYNQTADSKIPETIAAIGGLATSVATAYKTRVEASELRDEGDALKDPAAQRVKNVIADLDRIKQSPPFALSMNQLTQLDAIRLELDAQVTLLEDPNAKPSLMAIAAELSKQAKELDKLLINSGTHDPVSSQHDAKIRNHQANLNQTAAALDPKVTTEAPAFELYEIQSQGGATRLVRVNV